MSADEIRCPVDGCTTTCGGEHGKRVHLGRSHPSYQRARICEEISRLASGETPPTKKEFEQNADYTADTAQSQFASWNDAVRAAGFEPRNQSPDGKEEIISLIQELAASVGHTPTCAEFTDADFIPYSAPTVVNMFDSWNDAIRAAGFEPNQPSNGGGRTVVYSEDDVIRAIRDVADTVNQTPTVDLFEQHAPFSETVVAEHFGTWNDGLRAAGYEPTHLMGVNNGHVRYGPNWKAQRSAVVERDGRCCRVCDTHISSLDVSSIHVHHITPARLFGADDPAVDTDYEAMNALDNLISLCASCHKRLEGKFQDADPDEFAERGTAYLGYDLGIVAELNRPPNTVVVERETTLDQF